jgi:hypothetical protein
VQFNRKRDPGPPPQAVFLILRIYKRPCNWSKSAVMMFSSKRKTSR